MKKNIVFIGLFAISLALSKFTYAQNSMVSWGREHVTSSKFDEPTILGEADQYVYTYTYSGKGDRHLNKYDKTTLKLVYQKKITLPIIDKVKGEFGYIKRLKDKIYVFAEYVNKKERFYYVYAIEVDLNTGLLKSDYKQLVKAESETKKARGLNYLVLVSEDHSKVVFNYYAKHEKQNLYIDKYILMDHNLDILVEKEDQSELESLDYNTSDYTIDNDGSVYFLKRYTNGGTNIVSFDANKDFEKWEEEIDIAKSNPEIKGSVSYVKFNINKENNLIISGFYIEDDNLIGVFYLKIDNFTKETLVSKVSLFTEETIAELHEYIGKTPKKRDKDKTKKLLSDFNNVHVLQKDDGGSVLSSELYSAYIVYNRQGGIESEKYEYNGLLVVNLTKEGDIVWAKGITKKQYYGYSNFLFTFGSWGLGVMSWRPEIRDYFSYLGGFYEGKLFIFFNDNPKNYKLGVTKTYKLTEPKKATGVLYSFDMTTGVNTKSQLFNKKQYPFKIKPRVSYQESENSNLYLYAQKGRKCKLGVIPGTK